MKIGVLALQGDFKEHLASLARYHVQGLEVRTPEDLKQVDALILPGGESTTMAKLMLSTGLDSAIRARVKAGMPVWGTCAGAILLAKKVHSQVPLDAHLSLIDIEIERNSYGRQTESFAVELTFGKQKINAFFIRAPRILSTGRWVEVLAKHKGDPVLVKTKKVLVSTFHTELSSPNPLLELFLRDFVR